MMTLLQNLASQIEGGGRVFGFIAIIVTIVDGAVIMGMSLVFKHYDIQSALWITSAMYVAHGLLEVVFGPCLILSSPVASSDHNSPIVLTAMEENADAVPARERTKSIPAARPGSRPASGPGRVLSQERKKP